MNFWNDRNKLNSESALLYQWQMYEEVGTIDNFRIAAGLKEGKRRGFFYTDSDLHKWADAAAGALKAYPHGDLAAHLKDYIDLMGAAQEDDGYLYTFNQINFPGCRWKNLQIEHELYTLGHFIEAGISCGESQTDDDLFSLVIKAADLIVRDFSSPKPSKTPGHQEIELALIHLYRLTGEVKYLLCAQGFLDQRGKMLFPGVKLSLEVLSHNKRMRKIGDSNPGYEYGENIMDEEAPFINLRFGLGALSGSYLQQHKSLRKQIEPKGHSVRWAYMQTAAAMAARERDGDEIAILEKTWNELVNTKMHVTGGIGSLPVIEGFGKPFELDNKTAYCETCAAIGSIFWNHEMSSLTRSPRYSDLAEWQLYNAASVGISRSGDSYFYRNPLESDGNVHRHPWFETACCPSNISRLWARTGQYCLTDGADGVYLNQFITGNYVFSGLKIEVQSSLPWSGTVAIQAENTAETEVFLHIRQPHWAGRRPGEKVQFDRSLFETSSYQKVCLAPGETRRWKMDFPMEIYKIYSHPKVKINKGQFVLARGPLLYCLEGVDHPGLKLNDVVLPTVPLSSFSGGDLPGQINIQGQSEKQDRLVFTPYYDWGNRGQGPMQLWIRGD